MKEVIHKWKERRVAEAAEEAEECYTISPYEEWITADWPVSPLAARLYRCVSAQAGYVFIWHNRKEEWCIAEWGPDGGVSIITSPLVRCVFLFCFIEID